MCFMYQLSTETTLLYVTYYRKKGWLVICGCVSETAGHRVKPVSQVLTHKWTLAICTQQIRGRM